ncbi:MAG: flagellar hook-associated protein FlgK [Gammaproteobacteria bacterium]|nr:flagellar hook-associated protein FlgK [Gammaproteobacteria bacterium]
MSIINTALTGLIAAQRGLAVTANNVANAGTDGYVRRRIVQVEGVTVGTGLTADLGSGTRVVGVERMYSDFLGAAVRETTSSGERATVLASLGARLDSLLGNPELGIHNAIQSFFDQVESLARDPGSSSTRQQLLAQADSLGQRFAQLDTQLRSLDNEINLRMQDTASRINNLAAQLADINAAISRGISGDADLADQRDALLGQLSGLIDFSTTAQADGTTNVMVGNGQPLVLGINSASLELRPDAFDPMRSTLDIRLGNESRSIATQVGGGTMGGLLAFRSTVLDPARQQLGLLANTLGSVFNAQHAQGVDANGQPGGAFFTLPGPRIMDAVGNTGSASLAVGIEDASALQARDYELRFDGSSWSLRDGSSGQLFGTSGSGTAADPLRFDGLSVVVGDSADAGDRFLIRAVGEAASQLGLTIGDPAAIAAAAPLATSSSLGNQGTGTIAAASVVDPGHPALREAVELRFETAGNLRIYDADGHDLSGALAWSAGDDISFNGWSVRISGSVAAGDSFSVHATAAGSADNSNALALAMTSTSGFLAGGQISVDALAGRLLSDVGAAALRARQDAEVQSVMQEQARIDLEAAIGVNLDEEAANMLRYQQAYMAASQMIGVSNDLFRTLLGILN